MKADANVSSKIRRKSSEKSDHSKRKRSSLESVSTATLTVSVVRIFLTPLFNILYALSRNLKKPLKAQNLKSGY